MTASPSPTPTDSAGVRFPPPFLYVAVLLIGLALQRLWPIPVLPLAFVRGLGLVCALTALLGAAWGMSLFARARTSLLPDQPSSTLLTGGPFRISRNPLYLCLLLLYLGISLWLNALWPLLLAIPLVVLMNRLVITREERYLARAFGQNYEAYKARVRRWI